MARRKLCPGLRPRFSSPSAFARAIDADPSLILRWVAGRVRPSIDLLQRAAPVLRVPIVELISRGLSIDLKLQAPTDPLLIDIARVLAGDTGATENEIARLRTILGYVIDPYRVEHRRRSPGSR